MDVECNAPQAPEPTNLAPAPLKGLPQLRPLLVAFLAWLIFMTFGCLAGGRWYQGYLIGKQRLATLNLLSSKATALSAPPSLLLPAYETSWHSGSHTGGSLYL